MDWLDEMSGELERVTSDRMRRRWARRESRRLRRTLPRRARARLAVHRAADGTAAWLCRYRGGWRMAWAMYRVLRMIR